MAEKGQRLQIRPGEGFLGWSCLFSYSIERYGKGIQDNKKTAELAGVAMGADTATLAEAAPMDSARCSWVCCLGGAFGASVFRG